MAGTAANALIFAPLLLLGQAATGPASGLWLLVAVFVGLLLQNQLIHEQLDRKEDRAAVVAGGLFAGLAAPSGPARTRRGHRWFSLAAGLALFTSLLW